MTHRELIKGWAKKVEQANIVVPVDADDRNISDETEWVAIVFATTGKVWLHESKEGIEDVDCERLWNEQIPWDLDDDPINWIVLQRECRNCGGFHVASETGKTQYYIITPQICEFDRIMWKLRENVWDVDGSNWTDGADEIRSNFYRMLNHLIIGQMR